MERQNSPNIIYQVYHGSYLELQQPDICCSRMNADFGPGFYLTTDKSLAMKQSACRSTSFLNAYTLNTQNLDLRRLSLDKEWLEYVAANRTLSAERMPFDDSPYDVVIGPAADDSLLAVIDLYIDECISAENALRFIGKRGYKLSIVLKSRRAVSSGLRFEWARELTGLEQENCLVQIRRECAAEMHRIKQELYREFWK